MTTPRTASPAPSAAPGRSAAHHGPVGEQLNASHGSFELVLSPIILALVGLWLDRSVLDSTPWCTVVLAVVGFAGAVVKLYYGYRLKMSELAAERAAHRGGAR